MEAPNPNRKEQVDARNAWRFHLFGELDDYSVPKILGVQGLRIQDIKPRLDEVQSNPEMPKVLTACTTGIQAKF